MVRSMTRSSRKVLGLDIDLLGDLGLDRSRLRDYDSYRLPRGHMPYLHQPLAHVQQVKPVDSNAIITALNEKNYAGNSNSMNFYQSNLGLLEQLRAIRKFHLLYQLRLWPLR